MADRADLAILGGGNGGYACALRAAQLGLSVTLVEEDKVGGTCLHRGCIPTKALLHAAELVEEIRSAGNFGVVVGTPQVDGPRVSSYRDATVSKLYKGLVSVIKARKVDVVAGHGRVGVQVVAGAAGERGASIELETADGKALTLEAERCLVAVGRAPVSEGRGYEDVGVAVDRGFVVVDEWCGTGVEDVWAVGDLVAQPSLRLPFPHFQLAHVAFGEGIHVAEQVAGVGDAAPVDYVGVPRCTYTHPEIASVGLTEQQARDAGYEIEIARYPWSASGKATILGEPGGFVKV